MIVSYFPVQMYISPISADIFPGNAWLNVLWQVDILERAATGHGGLGRSCGCRYQVHGLSRQRHGPQVTDGLPVVMRWFFHGFYVGLSMVLL